MVAAKGNSDFFDAFPMAEKVLPAVAVGIAYSTVRTAYYQYYKPFGLTPEAAGLNVARILSDLVVGPVLISVLLSALCLAIYIAWHRIAGCHAPGQRTDSQNLVRVGALAASLGMIASGAYIAILARSASDKVQNDLQPIGSVVLDLGLLQVPLLQMPTRHVTSITLNSSGNSAIMSLVDDPCLLLMGESGGRSYFYQTQRRRLYSVQTDAVSYSVDASGATLASSCKPLAGTA